MTITNERLVERLTFAAEFIGKHGIEGEHLVNISLDCRGELNVQLLPGAFIQLCPDARFDEDGHGVKRLPDNVRVVTVLDNNDKRLRPIGRETESVV